MERPVRLSAWRGATLGSTNPNPSPNPTPDPSPSTSPSPSPNPSQVHRSAALMQFRCQAKANLPFFFWCRHGV
eukprot:scaffold25252_cov42-Phaeocystis_antarctica.AAC.1